MAIGGQWTLKRWKGHLEQALECGLLLCSWMLTSRAHFPFPPMKGCYCGFDSLQVTDIRVALLCLLVSCWGCCVRPELVPQSPSGVPALPRPSLKSCTRGDMPAHLWSALSIQQFISFLHSILLQMLLGKKIRGLLYPFAADVFLDFLSSSFSESPSPLDGPVHECFAFLLLTCVQLPSPVQRILPGRIYYYFYFY